MAFVKDLGVRELSGSATMAAAASVSPYILLVEDNPGDARLTQILLDDVRDTVLPPLRWVTSVADAVQVLEQAGECQAVLLDLGLPDCQGMATLHAIRPYARHCPVVVLTGEDNEDVGLAAVVDGAQDYLVKGSFDAGLLRRCIVFASHRKRAERALLERALHDELTGLPRRALFMDRLTEAMKVVQRNRCEGAVLFIDLDSFKGINDQHGHRAGDAVLRAVGQRISGALREVDTVARVGGDEFVVLLPTVAAPDDALTVARKVLQSVSLPVPFEGRLHAVSASIGVAGFKGDAESALDLIHRADQAMYAAKASGRGAIRCA